MSAFTPLTPIFAHALAPPSRSQCASGSQILGSVQQVSGAYRYPRYGVLSGDRARSYLLSPPRLPLYWVRSLPACAYSSIYPRRPLTARGSVYSPRPLLEARSESPREHHRDHTLGAGIQYCAPLVSGVHQEITYVSCTMASALLAPCLERSRSRFEPCCSRWLLQAGVVILYLRCPLAAPVAIVLFFSMECRLYLTVESTPSTSP